MKRQERQLLQLEARHSQRLPADLDYRAIPTLSMEAREKLTKVSSDRLFSVHMAGDNKLRCILWQERCSVYTTICRRVCMTKGSI